MINKSNNFRNRIYINKVSIILNQKKHHYIQVRKNVNNSEPKRRVKNYDTEKMLNRSYYKKVAYAESQDKSHKNAKIQGIVTKKPDKNW